MSILITGVGTVGFAVIEKFADLGFNVIAFSTNPFNMEMLSLQEKYPAIKLVSGDIRDISKIIQVIQEFHE